MPPGLSIIVLAQPK